MRIIDRFSKYMEINDLNDNQVTEICSLSIGLLGKARKGESDLGKKSIDKILSFYQDINRVWLLTGEGEMLKSEKKSQSSENNSGVNMQAGGDIKNSPVNETTTIDKLIFEMAEQRKDYVAQINRLLTIIEDK